MRFADHAVVGSANLSYHSRDKLDEAGVVLRDAATLAEIDAWFKARMGDPVSPGLLEECKKAYRKPKWPPLGGSQGAKPDVRSSSNLWIITTKSLTEVPLEEQAAASAATSAAEKKLKKPTSHSIDRIRWQGAKFVEHVKAEDLVIQVFRNRGQHVSPHGRVLSVRRTRTRRGKPVAYVCVEYPRAYLENPIGKRVMTGALFRRMCLTLGLKLAAGDIERLVRSAAAQRALRGLCSPETIL